MLNKDLVKKKLTSIDEYISEIAPVLENETAAIARDILKLRAIERNFQLIVDTMLDINTHIIAAERLKAPNSLQETFFILAQSGVLSEDLVNRMAPVVGLRNKIVHEYEGISTEKFIEDLKEGVHQFGEFIAAIVSYLEKDETKAS